MSKNFKVLYFARLREDTQIAEELVKSNARTGAELFAELDQKYNFSLKQSKIRLAINESFTSWESPLEDGMTLAFIPPVAGG